MASEGGASAGSKTRRNFVAATTLVVAALGSRSARAREHEQYHGHHGGGSHCYLRAELSLAMVGYPHPVRHHT